MQQVVDDKLYTVVSDNGYRSKHMKRADAFRDAQKIHDQCVMYGWRVKVRVYYRDGSEVDWRGAHEPTSSLLNG